MHLPIFTEDLDLNERLAVFRDAGLLTRLPTLSQLRQAEIEMIPYVVSSDVTAEETYSGGPWSHPLLRQPLIFNEVGYDHLRTGSALGAKLESVCTHLQLTSHRGMPVYDLQVIQTHKGGLDQLEQAMHDILDNSGVLAQRHRKLATRLLYDPDAYFQKYIGEDGWIARARRFDYATPADEESAMPVEFFSLVGLCDYAARTFPSDLNHLRWYEKPGYAYGLFSRRFREGHRLGWFDGFFKKSAA